MLDAVSAEFGGLFRPTYVAYADADVVGTLTAPDADLVHRVHLIALPAPGVITVCESVEGWRFLPGGRLEPGETIDAAVRRELAEEAGSEPIEAARFFFSQVATSRRAQPYLAHVPHPVTWWAYGICRTDVTGAPTAPADGEQIVAVHHLPVDDAITWLAADPTGAVHADVVRLAAHLDAI